MLSVNSLFYYYDVCVCSAQRQVLPIVLELRRASASYPDVSLDMRAKEGGKDCTLPMVPCGVSPVTRFALASAMRKTKRLRRRLGVPLDRWVRATFFHSIQHSRSRTRSPCRKVWPSQTLCLLLMTDMMALSSPTRLNTSSLQTLSDQKMLETFLQNISQLCGFNVPDSTPYRIESTPDDSLYNSLLQSKAEGSCQQFS